MFNGFPKPNDDSIFMGFDGGFAGYVSRLKWANKTLSPEEIYARYEEGPKILNNPFDSLTDSNGEDNDE